MRIVRDESYEEMAHAFQLSQIQLLERVLDQRGVSADERRAICGDFIATQGVVLDQYWLVR